MFVGIDHVVIAVTDPDAAATELAARLGLEPGGGGRHDRLGTYNRLLWLGDTYLELIGVFDASLAATSWIGAPALRAIEAGGGLATWAIASDDLDADVATLRGRGSLLAGPIAGERVRPDGRAVRWRLAAGERLDPDRPPFLIEHDLAAAEWTPAERAARADGPGVLDVLELAVDDVDRTSQAFLRTVGLRFRPSLAGGGARDADIGAQRVRLRPARGPTGTADRRPSTSVRGMARPAWSRRWAVAGHPASGHRAREPLTSARAATRPRWPGPPIHASSHPEDAEARLRDRRVERRLDAHRQDAPRIQRVDDAVVPEPCRREVRRALRARRSRGSAPRRRRARRRSANPPRTVERTRAACGPPMTEIRAFGHDHRKRGW